MWRQLNGFPTVVCSSVHRTKTWCPRTWCCRTEWGSWRSSTAGTWWSSSSGWCASSASASPSSNPWYKSVCREPRVRTPTYPFCSARNVSAVHFDSLLFLGIKLESPFAQYFATGEYKLWNTFGFNVNCLKPQNFWALGRVHGNKGRVADVDLVYGCHPSPTYSACRASRSRLNWGHHSLPHCILGTTRLLYQFRVHLFWSHFRAHHMVLKRGCPLCFLQIIDTGTRGLRSPEEAK